METEHIMGNSCARRTINKIIQTMSESHYLSLETFVTRAIDQKWLLVLVIDDYTSVHTKRRPLNEKPSEAKTMCTIVRHMVVCFSQTESFWCSELVQVRKTDGNARRKF